MAEQLEILQNPVRLDKTYLEGERFGDLIVLYLDHVGWMGHNQFMCECSCGEMLTVDERMLVGKSPPRSCGCKK